ncbi:fimbrial protein [Pseudomonas sp. CAN2814]|uniref:fimbrial protein n=1 Tax=Pseudomonas sp. CAN1 TaxID=3046726 RepID=UPI00264995E2|nr:fimbrial protein [Pseudomonas sp. CAN1]MDN6859915.1 fimbrial protein [Pseudomonas sp. CAN1]
MQSRFIVLAAVLVGVLFVGQSSWAAICSFTSGGPGSYTIPAIPPISVSRDIAPGTPLTSVLGPYSTSTAKVSCVGKMWVTGKFGPVLEASGIENVYKTNVPGVGIKMWNGGSATPVYFGNSINSWGVPSDNYSGDLWLRNTYLQFIAIGTVSAGNYSLSNPIMEGYASASPTAQSNALLYASFSLNSFAITARSCATPNVTVNLGKHKISEFTGIGSVSSSTPFNFAMNNCMAGMASISYMFQPVTSLISSPAQYITLDGSSTASGVGIQVLFDNDTPVPFNIKTRFTGYSGAAGSYSIPMKARYIKIADTLKAGTANSSVVFTMTYE